jgi:hypothetical protein
MCRERRRRRKKERKKEALRKWRMDRRATEEGK